MNKKFIVRLSDEERVVCREMIKKLKGSSEKVRRAQILLKADADGPHGRTQGSQRLSTVGCKRSRMFADGWWLKVLKRLWNARNARTHRRSVSLMGRRKRS